MMTQSKWFTAVKRTAIAILFGILGAIAINIFLVNAHCYTSGITGIAQVIQSILATNGFNVSLSLLMVILNAPLYLFGFCVFGLQYIGFSLLTLVSNVIFLQIIPQVAFVKDPLTNTILGGLMFGIGVGLCFNNGFTTGGTDIIVTYCQTRFLRKVGFINNIVNGGILLASLIFFGPSKIIYSAISIVVTSCVIDYVFTLQHDISVTIFSKHPEKIIDDLKDFTHGATILNGTGIYTKEPTTVILVIAQLPQLKYLEHLVKRADPQSFVCVSNTTAAEGEYNRSLFQ